MPFSLEKCPVISCNSIHWLISGPLNTYHSVRTEASFAHFILHILFWHFASLYKFRLMHIYSINITSWYMVVVIDTSGHAEITSRAKLLHSLPVTHWLHWFKKINSRWKHIYISFGPSVPKRHSQTLIWLVKCSLERLPVSSPYSRATDERSVGEAGWFKPHCCCLGSLCFWYTPETVTQITNTNFNSQVLSKFQRGQFCFQETPWGMAVLTSAMLIMYSVTN